MAKSVYTLVITRDPYDPKALNVDVPEIPGCHTWGRSMRQAIESAKKMIALCLETEDEAEHAPSTAKIVHVEVAS